MPTGTMTVVVMARCNPDTGSSVRLSGGAASPLVPEVAEVMPLDPLIAGGGAAIARATYAPPRVGAAGGAPPDSEERLSVAGEPLLPAVLGAAKGSAAIFSLSV